MNGTSEQVESSLNPEPLLRMSMSFASARVLSAGVQLDVFSHIAAGHKTAAEVAQAAVASERGMRRLLDALTMFQLLANRNGYYELTPLAAKFLVRGSSTYIGERLENDHLWESWGKLVEAVRTGKPVRRGEQEGALQQFYLKLARSLHVMNLGTARNAARVLGAGMTHKGLRVVDVGCGSGVWSIAIAECDAEAHITLQDFPEVLDLTREYINRHGVEARCDFLPGNLKHVDFGEGRFDVALLGNILHLEGEISSRDLLKRLYRALTPGGRVIIMDVIPNNERTGPRFQIIFDLTMLLNTEVGGAFTLAEYSAWLAEAGFARVETADIGSHSPLIIGLKD